MTPDELRKELEAREIRPAYLLVGEEPLLREDALAALRSVVLGAGPEDFNFDRLDGASTSAGALRDSIHALPVMASHRLVWLRDPERARGGGPLGAALADIIPEVLAQDTTVLAITSASVDKRSRWFKALAAPASVVACDPPKGIRAVLGFLSKEAASQGVKLTRDAAELLAERVGPQLLVLRQEVAKLALVAGPGAAVERQHVELTVCRMAEEPVWDLTDAIGSGRSGEAVALLGRLLAGGAPAPMILGSLASHFRRLCRLRSGGSVSGPPFVRRKLESQARRYSEARLVACLRAIHHADTALKGASALRPELALERLVLGLAG